MSQIWYYISESFQNAATDRFAIYGGNHGAGKVSAAVEENMKTIFAYALSRVSHREDAEDLAGDIILAILKSAPKIRDDNAFFGYIWAIAANTYRKYLRGKGRLL